MIFFEKDDKYKFFKASNSFQNLSHDYLYLYIKNQFLGIQQPFEFLWAGKEFQMNIVQWKKKC